MKRFFTLSILLFLISLRADACAFAPVTNYYVFNLFAHTDRTQALVHHAHDFWEQYAGRGNGDAIERLQKEGKRNVIWQTAVRKNDKEMQAYLAMLMHYPGFEEFANQWDYPTKAELTNRKRKLLATQRAVAAYHPKRLKSQFLLLGIRAAFGLQQYDKVVQLWQKREKMAHDYAYSMGKNLYAGALYHQGKVETAADIFAEQDDWQSLRWTLRKERNVAGIRTTHHRNANSKILFHLIQDFVNNTQETYDATHDSYAESVWWNGKMHEKATARHIVEGEVENFVRLADEVTAHATTPNAAMWQSAAAMLRYYQGKHEEATQRAHRACEMAGDKVVKENARMVKLVVSTATAKNEKPYRDYLLAELRHLDQACRNSTSEVLSDNHSYRIRTRLIHQELEHMFARWAEPENNIYLAAYDEMSNMAISSDEQAHNPWYEGKFVTFLNEMAAKEVIAFTEKLRLAGRDDLETWLRNNCYSNADFYNDYIGTRLLEQGEFEQAIVFLQRVPKTFLEHQNIALYAAQRDYNIEAWINPQWTKNEYDYATKYALKSNQKVDFCHDILRLQADWKTATGQRQSALAYRLANLYYQASPIGRCWYLARYHYEVPLSNAEYQSLADDGFEAFLKHASTEHPFVGKARKLLEESAKSSDKAVRLKSLFALAFLPSKSRSDADFARWDWDSKTGETFVAAVDTNAPQAQFFEDIYQLSTHEKLPHYISNCALYRVFVKQKN